MTASTPRVLVLVGTDHHPFDRLVGWVDDWAASHPGSDVLVQHGQSRAPAVAPGRPFLEREEMLDAIARADVVVCHGGPATISEARAAGHRPLVVPRNPAHGEHVDDHQMRFSAWLAGKGLIEVCGDQQALATALDESPTRGAGAGAAGSADAAASTARFGRLVDEAMSGTRPRSAPTVLYLAGFGRSGSTLLERLLGQSDEVACLGEVAHLWERGVLADETCGCGQPFHQCPFWTEVGEVAFGGWDPAQARRVLELRREVDRKRRIPVTALPTPPPALRRALAEHAAAYASVYRAAASVTGARLVVDSSKHVSLAFALSHDADLDLRVLHLVRDPRAVAYSWSKEVDRPEARAGTSDADQMPRYSPRTSAGRWTTTNLLAELLRSRGRPQVRVRYEDLVSEPDRTLQAAASALDLPVRPSITLSDHTVQLDPIHSVAGNPMRFTSGAVTLRVDDAWTTAMSAADQRTVQRLTGPLSRWYNRSED